MKIERSIEILQVLTIYTKKYLELVRFFEKNFVAKNEKKLFCWPEKGRGEEWKKTGEWPVQSIKIELNHKSDYIMETGLMSSNSAKMFDITMPMFFGIRILPAAYKKLLQFLGNLNAEKRNKLSKKEKELFENIQLDYNSRIHQIKPVITDNYIQCVLHKSDPAASFLINVPIKLNYRIQILPDNIYKG